MARGRPGTSDSPFAVLTRGVKPRKDKDPNDGDRDSDDKGRKKRPASSVA